MLLYHYRSIDSALLEIGNGTFHFSSCEELNDPIEGYIRVFWKGDKAAWEGMFRNYVCSVSHAINMYLLRGDEEILHHQTLIIDLNYYDNGQHGQAFKELGNGFLGDEEIQRLAAFYGNNRLKVYEKELKLVFNFIHNKALTLCIRKCLDYGTMPEEMANNLLKMFQSKAFLFPFDLLESELDDEEHRSKITKDAEDAIEDICDLQYVRLGFDDDTFLYGKRKDESGQIIKENAITEARQRRNWMAIAVDFPKVYVEQMKEMIYPESYVVCFSEKNNDSSMWGNYADCHKGVCLIYEGVSRKTWT